jgi:WD40 repeat protein
MALATQAADEMVKEYLLFRGLTAIHTAFEKESQKDKDKVENIVLHLLSLISNSDLEGFSSFWDHILKRFVAKANKDFSISARKIEISLRRYYLVHCVESANTAKIREFFETAEGQAAEWQEWWLLPYIKSPETHPNFEQYFAKSWSDSITISLYNFLSSVLHSIPLPFLLQVQKPKPVPVSTASTPFVKVVPPSTASTEFSSEPPPRAEPQPVTPQAARPEFPRDDFLSSTPSRRAGEVESAFAKSPSSAVLDTTRPRTDTTAKGDAPAWAGTAAVIGSYNEHSASISLIAISPRGSFVASLDTANTLHFWSCPPGRIARRHHAALPVDDRAMCMTWIFPEDQRVAVALRSARVLVLGTHGLQAEEELVTIPDARDVAAMACSPTGALLACAAVENSEQQRGIVAFVDVASRSIIGRVFDAAPIVTVRFSSGGEQLVCGTSDGRVLVVDSMTQDVLHLWTAHPGAAVYDARPTADGSGVLSLGGDGLVLRTPLPIHRGRRSLLQLDMRLDLPPMPARPHGLHHLLVDAAEARLLVVQTVDDLSPDGVIEDGDGRAVLELHRMRDGERRSSCASEVTRMTRPTALDWCAHTSLRLLAAGFSDGRIDCYEIRDSMAPSF